MTAVEDNWLLSYLKPIVGDTPFEPLRCTGVFPKTIRAPESAAGESWTIDVVALDHKSLPLDAFKALYKVCFDNYIAKLLKATEAERDAMHAHLVERFAGGDLLRLLGLRRVTATGEAVVSLAGHCILVDVWTAAARDVLGRPRQYGVWLKEAMMFAELQAAGIGADVLHELILTKAPTFMCSRTQIPSVLALFSHLRWESKSKEVAGSDPKSDSVVLPLAFMNAASGKPELPVDVQQFCLEVLQSVDGLKKAVPVYDHETMVFKKLFSPTVCRVPVQKKHPIWRILQQLMNPAAGDALFSVVFPVTEAAKHNARTEIVSRLSQL